MAKPTKSYASRYKIFKFLEPDIVPDFLDFLETLPKSEGIETLSDPKRNIPRETLKVFRAMKNTFEAGKGFVSYKNIPEFPEVNAWLYDRLDTPLDQAPFPDEWVEWTQASQFTGMTYSYMPTGCFYKAHLDSPDLGEFSTTLFLEDPNEYEGGELEVLYDGEVKQFKLEPGYGVTYETGTPHLVRPVTSGARKCCLWWTNSKLPNLKDLYKYREYLDKIGDRYPKDVEDLTDDLHECYEKPNVYWAVKADQLARHFKIQ